MILFVVFFWLFRIINAIYAGVIRTLLEILSPLDDDAAAPSLFNNMKSWNENNWNCRTYNENRMKILQKICREDVEKIVW